MKAYYTCEEVARMYQVKTSTVWTWVRTGKLEAHRIGRLIRIHSDQLQRFDKEREVPGNVH